MLQKSKRGGTFSVQFLIGVVIAIACISMLVYLGAQLYGTFERKTDLQQARVQLDKILYALDHLEEGETTKILIESPNNWWILAWPYKDFRTDKGKTTPDLCKQENCLCICKMPNAIRSSKENSLELCEEMGTCLDYNMPIKTIDKTRTKDWIEKLAKVIASLIRKDTSNIPIHIDQPLQLTIYQSNNKIIVEREID